MAAKAVFTLFVSVLFLMSCNVLGFPNSGKDGCNITSQSKSCNVTHAMFSGGSVLLKITLRQDVKATVKYTVEKQCSTEERCFKDVSFDEKNGIAIHNIEPLESCILAKNNTNGDASTEGDSTKPDGDGSTEEDSIKPDGDGSTGGNSTKLDGDGSTGGNSTDQDLRRKKRESSQNDNENGPPQAILEFAKDGIYMVKIEVLKLEITSEQKKGIEDKNANNTLLEVSVIMNNTLGYLDAADYPYLVFYSLMFVGYFFLGIIWSICMCCSCKNLIRLQLFIGVVILLGFAEKLFFVDVYGYVNTTGERYSIVPLLIIAEGISAGKKTFARVLLIIISSGFGTVRPQLGTLLWKVLVFGAIFFAATLADGFVREYYYNPLEGFNSITSIPAIIQVILDTICIFWIVSSLIRTRRTLKENNDHRLNTYNHFCCALVVISIAILAFLLWIIITTLMGTCTQDWKGFWLRECFWPLLFTLLLVVIMILWRPSSTTNTGKVVYTAVPRGETKEMGVKDNFETMRMRHGSKSEGLPLNSDSEEDVIFFQ